VQIFLLYVVVVLVWSSTWIGITFQLGPVAVELSIAYRFALAALVLYAYAAISRRPLRIPASQVPMVLLQGTLLFCINYLLVYYATLRITSGLVAVLFSSILVFNAVFERLFFGTEIDRRLGFSALLGLSGITMIFWPEVASLTFKDDAVMGIVLALSASLIASLGNMVAVVNNTRRQLPVIAVNAHAMTWGALLAFCVVLLLGRDLVFSTEPAYVWSLLYLAVFGSAVAFGCYLALLKLIGPARAGYSSIMFPVVALLLSTAIEGYRWTAIAGLGMMMTVAGNWLILSSRKTATQATTGKNTNEH
jgi:drug/metabolite transporter (DMT)-like permease